MQMICSKAVIVIVVLVLEFILLKKKHVKLAECHMVTWKN